MVSQKIPVDHHSSVVIVHDGSENQRFFLSGYDLGYPWNWGGYANLLGGNHKPGVDKSPRDILEREVSEEVDISKIPEELQDRFAPRDFVEDLRSRIIREAKPYLDFLIQDPYATKGNKSTNRDGERRCLVSVYKSYLPITIMDSLDSYLSSGKNVVSEGVVQVAGLDKLIGGEVPMAWCSPVILGHFLDKTIPNPRGANAIPIGDVRESFQDYKNCFDYLKPVD